MSDLNRVFVLTKVIQNPDDVNDYHSEHVGFFYQIEAAEEQKVRETLKYQELGMGEFISFRIDIMEGCKEIPEMVVNETTVGDALDLCYRD